MVWLANPERYGQMQYRYCGKSGLRLPALSLGLWHNFGHVNALESQRAILRKAFDLGITHFDLANNYGPPPGSAESNFGRILREDFLPWRDELIISSKAGYTMWDGPYGDWGSRKYLVASLDQSLKRMGLEYVDIFYHHRPDPETPLQETMRALDEIKSLMGISSEDGVDADELPNSRGEFGITLTNPIPCNTIMGSMAYLESLRAPDGSKISYERIGSFTSPVTTSPVDGYKISHPSGKELTTLYLSPYQKRNSKKSPKDFRLVSPT